MKPLIALPIHTFKALFNTLRYLPLVVRTHFAAKLLDRRNETSAVSSGEEQVSNYNQVMSSRLAVFYAIALQAVYRAFSPGKRRRHLDIAPGPGHFSLLANDLLQLEKTTGVDRSAPMVAIANKNAAASSRNGLVSFVEGDATNLSAFESNSIDLVTMTFASHHLPTHSNLRQAIAEMDRIAAPEGLVALIDLIRLPTAAITEDFVKLAGRDYITKGWPAFYDDFYQSMYAAWTTEEMTSAVPRHSPRKWVLLANGGIPTLQILLGFPANQATPFVRGAAPWRFAPPFLAPDLIPEWWLAKIFQFMGKKIDIETDF